MTTAAAPVAKGNTIAIQPGRSQRTVGSDKLTVAGAGGTSTSTLK